MSKHVRCQSKHSPFLNDWCGGCNQLWPCEVARLEQWKAEATEVIERWELVYEALGDVGGLGQARSDAVLAEVLRLKAEVERLNDVIARMDAEVAFAHATTVEVQQERDAAEARLRTLQVERDQYWTAWNKAEADKRTLLDAIGDDIDYLYERARRFEKIGDGIAPILFAIADAAAAAVPSGDEEDR